MLRCCYAAALPHCRRRGSLARQVRECLLRFKLHITLRKLVSTQQCRHCPPLHYYSLKLLKSQLVFVPLLKRKEYMEVLSAVYQHVRLHPHEDWLGGKDPSVEASRARGVAQAAQAAQLLRCCQRYVRALVQVEEGGVAPLDARPAAGAAASLQCGCCGGDGLAAPSTAATGRAAASTSASALPLGADIGPMLDCLLGPPPDAASRVRLAHVNDPALYGLLHAIQLSEEDMAQLGAGAEWQDAGALGDSHALVLESVADVDGE